MSKTPRRQLEKKLYRACIGSDVSDEEMIDAVNATLIAVILNLDRPRWEGMAKTVARNILVEFDVRDEVRP